MLVCVEYAVQLFEIILHRFFAVYLVREYITRVPGLQTGHVFGGPARPKLGPRKLGPPGPKSGLTNLGPARPNFLLARPARPEVARSFLIAILKDPSACF